MTKQYYKWTVLVLTLSGVLFSGYLSGVKFFSKTCAFNESCPYFLGYPACYFGFAMFLALFLTTSALVLGKASFAKVLKINLAISLLGTAYATYFAVPEIRAIMAGTFESRFLGLSTCVYGQMFFILVLLITAVTMFRRRSL
jgi:hypothetical protein